MKQTFLIGTFLLLCSLTVAFFQSGEAQEPPEELFPVVIDQPQTETAQMEVKIEAPQETPAVSYDESTTIRVLVGEEVLEMTLCQFLEGALAAEMPASFQPEALKAQAVAARTNAVRKLQKGSKHQDADICGESTCCMGWKESSDPAFAAAVAETDGQVVCYDGSVIDAVFFSCSWGKTEDAVAVWGSATPYLVSVDSPEETIDGTVSVPLTEFCLKVMETAPQADFSGDWLGDILRTESGAVESAVIGGQSISGTQLRSLFSLRSACFDMELTATGVVFSTRGYGHGVGMSQYGANELAAQGKTYDQILAWYYQGTEIETLS